MRLLPPLLFLLPLALASLAPAQTVIYVDPDATGTQSGDSWANAYVDLQDALAFESGPGEIWVKQGIYEPSDGLSTGAAFTLVDGLDLYGGFNGLETSRSQRDPERYPTILSGDLQQDDVGGVISGPNSSTILRCPVGVSANVDGFTISSAAGNNTDTAAVDLNGTTTLTDCILENHANLAVDVDGATGTAFIRCLFRKVQRAVDLRNSPATFTDCRFEERVGTPNNEIVLVDIDELSGFADTEGYRFTRCHFSDGDVRAIATNLLATGRDPDCLIEESTFTGAAGGSSSSAVYVGIGDGVDVRACVFTNWRNNSSGNGGAINGDGTSKLRVDSCVFRGNENSVNSFGGGAIYGSAFGGSLEVRNSIFQGNRAANEGGAIRSGASTTIIIGCSFQGNSAGTEGGALYVNSTAVVTNCVLWNNSANGATNTASASIGGSLPILNNTLAENINPGGTNLDGTVPGNDPLFLAMVDPATAPVSGGDLRLQTGSPVIDQGDNTANTAASDVAGGTRIQGGTIDLGGYESNPTQEIEVSHSTAGSLSDGVPLDLGLIPLGAPEATLEFVIENAGLATLGGIGVSITGPSAASLSLDSTPAASLASYADSTFEVTLTQAGEITATIEIASDDPDENPFSIPITATVASTASDADNDGLVDFDERVLGLDPDNPDSDGDGVSDGAEINLAAFGFSNYSDDSALALLLQDNVDGIDELYSASSLQALALSPTVIARDAGTGNFKLTTGLLLAPSLEAEFSPLIDYTPTYDPLTGEIEIEFAPPNAGASFFQVFGKVPGQ